MRQLLQDEKIPIERFPQDLRKYSRNFELSQYIERLGLGAVFDADLIYDKSFAPRSIKMNLTVPVSESEFNMFEFGFRQVGLEDEIRKLVGPHLKGRNAPEIMTEVVAEIVDLFDQESNNNEVQNGRFPRNVQKRQNIFNKLNSKDDVEAAFYLNVDGKTIAYVDIADLTRPENDMSQAIRSMIQEVKRTDKVDRAYALMFMKNEFEVPSKEGKTPVAVNGTIIFGFKGDKNTFVPSIAVEMSTRTSDKKYLQRLSSSADVRFDVQYRNNRPVKVALKMPKESQKLFRFHSAVFDVDSRGIETPSSASFQKISKCSTGLTRPLGIEFCAKVATPDEMLSNGLPPFNGLWEVELELLKTDRQMSSWELALEVPQMASDEQTYRLAFDTPDSRVNRRTAILLRSYDQFRGLQLKLESPAASWDASASYVMSANEWSTKSELTTGSNDKYSFEAGMRSDAKGKKQEWIPVLRVSAPGMEPIALAGAVSMSRGRKSQLNFELRPENNDKRFLKGSLVQEGAISMIKDFRLSSDVQADFGPISFRVFSNAEQQANSLSTDLKIDYQTPNSRKHSVKVVGKLHNLSTASYAKVNSFVEAQTSQYPEKNFHVSWNVLVKPQEHLENELTVMWADQMRDQNKKIHILQVSKATGLGNGRAVTAENILSVEIAPINFKYEFKASGSMERSQTPKYKVQLEMNNKNQKEDDVLVSFEVQHVSSKPFKMTIDAALITAACQLKYSDKVEEVSPRVYKGRTQIEWQQDKKTTIGYTLKVKSDKQKTDLEMDAEIKTPSMRHGLRHQGHLRASSSSVELQSKVYYEKSNIWDVESILRRQGKSTLKITTKGFEGKAEAQLSSSPKNIMVELKGNDFSHFSNLLIAKDAVTLTSKTMSEQKPVLVINARKNGKDATRVNLECTMFDARIELSGRGESPAAVFDFRGKNGDKLALKTKATFSPSEGLELSGESKSESFALHSASLKVKRSDRGVSVAVHSEHNNREWLSGKALLEEVATGLSADAQFSQWGSQVARFHSQLHRQVFTGPHDLEINFRSAASSQQQTLKIHHEIGNGEAKCVCTYFVNGEQKGQLENFARFKSSRSELEVAAGITLKSEIKYHGLDGVHVSFQHQHKNERRNFQSETRVKGQVSQEQKYELALTSARSGDRKVGKASIKLALETPIYDFKQQSSQWTAQWTEETIKVDHKTAAKDVIVTFQTSVRKSDLVSGPHDLKAEYSVPRAAPWSLLARHELVDGNLNSNAEFHVSGKKQLSAQAVGQLKSQNGQIDFSGPHDLELHFQTPSSDAQTIKIHHEARNGQIKCLLTHLIQGQEKQRLQNQAQIQCPALLECQFSANLALKSQLYEQLDGFTASLDHKHKISRKGLQVESKLTGQNANDKYQMSLAAFGNGDEQQGKLNIKAGIETPIAKFEKQTAEIDCRWSNEKITLDHKIHATDVRVAMKTNVNRNLFSGPHDFNIEVDAPRVRPFAAVGKHEVSGGNWKTNLEVTELRNQQRILSASCRLQQTDERITAQLEAEVNNKRFMHESELLTKADELALESKTHWQNQPIATIKSRLSQRQPAFVDIDCPIFKLRADADSTQSPITGSLNFANKVGNKEQLKYRFTIEEGKSVQVHAEGKSASIPEYSADLKAQMSRQSYAGEYNVQKNGREVSGGEGKFNWQRGQGVRANARVTRGAQDFARFDINTADDLISGPHDMTIEFVTPRSNPYSLQMKHQLDSGNLRSSSDVRVDGKQRLGVTVTGLMKRSTDRFDLNLEASVKTPAKTHEVKYESFVRQSRRDAEAKSTLTFQNQKYMELHGLYSPNKKTASYESEHVNAKFQIISGQEDKLIAQVTGKQFTHFTEAIGTSDMMSLESKTNWKNQPIVVISSRIQQTDASFIDIQSRIFDCRAETASLAELSSASIKFASHVADREAGTCRVRLSGKTLDVTAEWKSRSMKVQAASLKTTFADESIDARFQLTQEGQEYANGQAELSTQGRAIKVNAQVTQQGEKVAAVLIEANKNWISGPHEIQIESKVPQFQPFTLMVKHKTENENLKTKIDVRVNGQQRLAVDASGLLRQARDRFELNFDGQIKTSYKTHHVKYESFARQSRNTIEAKSKMTLQKKPLFDVQSYYSPEKNMLKFETEQVRGKIEAQLGQAKRFTADISGSRLTHLTQASLSLNELTLESKTHWDRRPVVVIKTRLHESEKSFIDIESVIFDCRAETDNVRYPSYGSVNFASKVGDQTVVKCRVTVDGIKALEISAEAKSSVLPKSSFSMKARNTDAAYLVEYQIRSNGKDLSAGQATLTPRGHGLSAVAKMTQHGQEVMRLDAQVDEKWISGPHDIEVVLPQTGRSQPGWFKIHHEIANGKVNSSVVRMVNGKQRPIGNVSGRGLLDTMTGLYMDTKF